MEYAPKTLLPSNSPTTSRASTQVHISRWMIIAAFTRSLVFFIFIFWMLFSFRTSRETFEIWITGFIGSFQSELAGIAFTLLVLDFLRWIGDRALNKEVNEVAQEVVDKLDDRYKFTELLETIKRVEARLEASQAQSPDSSQNELQASA